MKNLKKFVLVAVLAVGGIAGVAAVDAPVAGTQRACADDSHPGWRYWGSFSTHDAASSKANYLEGRGYYTSIERSYGKYYLYFR